MNSGLKINYEVRPHKFAERLMILNSLQVITNKFEGKYQYIGFGALSFTDFKLFHTNLDINEMHNIEGGTYNQKRIEYNCPYGFIKNHYGMSSTILSSLEYKTPTIVWLDYDGTINESSFIDLSILIRHLPIGSVYIMSCVKKLENKNSDKITDKEQFNDCFDGFKTLGIENKDIAENNIANTIRRMMAKVIKDNIAERNKSGNKVKFEQLFNLTYNDNQHMYTYGGIILDAQQDVITLDLDKFPFIYKNDNAIYNIIVPNLTIKEYLLLSSCIGHENPKNLYKDIITKDTFDQFINIYRYMPKYYDVRL